MKKNEKVFKVEAPLVGSLCRTKDGVVKVTVEERERIIEERKKEVSEKFHIKIEDIGVVDQI